MNCRDAKEWMLDRLYGELPTDGETKLAEHLADCEACRRESARLQETRRLLDMTPDCPASLGVARVYELAAARSQRSRRRWRLAAVSASAAAVMLLALGAVLASRRLQIERSPGRLVLSWRTSGQTPVAGQPAGPNHPEPAATTRDPWPTLAQHTDRLATLDELVRLVVKELDSADQRDRAQLTALRQDFQDLRTKNNLRLDVLDRDVSDAVTLLTSSLNNPPKKGS
jgi:hypothetical protein